MNPIIYDTEIKYGVATEDNPPQAGYRYAEGWSDFAGMGIATICAYDVLEARYRVFMDDNLHMFADLMDARDAIVGFNNFRFDDRLLETNGILIPEGKTIDLAALIWRGAGIPQGEHPRGLSLAKICEANNLPGKSGNGADAPQDFQDGKIGRVIDYCLGDVRATLHLYRLLVTNGGVTDPRNGDWLNVTAPR